MLHKNMTCFCKGHICLFTCYLISLSAPNKTGPAACFILKKQDQFCKVEKSDPLSELTCKIGPYRIRVLDYLVFSLINYISSQINVHQYSE
jgi:hypothetical protein